MVQIQGNNQNDGSLKDLWIGIAISFGLYALALILMMFMGLTSFFLAVLVHIILTIVSFVKEKKRLGQGLLIGLGIVFLLVAACFGILIYSFSFS